jgi:hypothetical protein
MKVDARERQQLWAFPPADPEHVAQAFREPTL